MQGYRTYIAAALVAALGAAQMFDWVTFLNTPKSGAFMALASAILMAVMRSFTTTPPGVSK